ncbi:putative transmembrane protein [Pseudomonas aeruginosa]|nr:putative transmembrane protein [Pseudomonas aeruginosa]
MPDRRTLLLTVLALLAFAGNSLLCRAALKDTAIDAVSFTALRLFSGALMLAVLLHLRRRPATPARGGWRGAAALFVYAAAFSYAYVQLDAGTGALLLFGAVQVTLLLAGLLRGERLGGQALLGFLLALGGLLFLLLPGASAPPLGGALLMLLSGLAWGLYYPARPRRRRSAGGQRGQLPACPCLRRPAAPGIPRAVAAGRRRAGLLPCFPAPSPPASATPSGTAHCRG